MGARGPNDRWWGRINRGTDGLDFVRCRLCGERRRVISGMHLSKHDTDRASYLAEFKLSPDQLIAKAFRVLQSSRRGYKPNGKAEWATEIKNIHATQGVAGLQRLERNRPILYGQGVWLFGKIDAGFRFVGLDPDEIRLSSRWEDAKLRREIRKLRNRRLPLYANYVMKHHSKLFKHGIARHGSWPKALMAHGITPPPKRYRLHLLTRLRDTLESGAKLSKEFRWQLEYYFGSVEKAKPELKTNKRALIAWSPRKVIALVKGRYRRKLSLAYAVVRRENPAWVSAAEKFYGSWGNTLFAAGHNPNEHFVHLRWRKKKRKMPPLGIRRNPLLLEAYKAQQQRAI